MFLAIQFERDRGGSGGEIYLFDNIRFNYGVSLKKEKGDL